MLSCLCHSRGGSGWQGLLSDSHSGPQPVGEEPRLEPGFSAFSSQMLSNTLCCLHEAELRDTCLRRRSNVLQRTGRVVFPYSSLADLCNSPNPKREFLVKRGLLLLACFEEANPPWGRVTGSHLRGSSNKWNRPKLWNLTHPVQIPA